MQLLRILLYPISLLFGLLTFFRNKLYDWEVLSSKFFDVPVIAIGNLSTGGTGKTPHVEYLIRLLKDQYRIAILSRGYKRKTKGFILAAQHHSFMEIGDEPTQFYSKFDDIHVAVDENRVHGIEKLLELQDPPEVILLDDAFQHRKVKPGYSILLTDFYNLYARDHMLPTGNLREFKSGSQRADVIIVTKSPKVLSPFTRQRVTKELKPNKGQHLFFSYIRHGKLTAIPGVDFKPEGRSRYSAALLVAGIANPYPLEMYLKDKINHVETLIFPDHHHFTGKAVEDIIERFDRILIKNKIMVTTEKDMMRLKHPDLLIKLKTLPLCYVPMEIRINKDDREEFDKSILKYVKETRGNNPLHQTKD
ncbi:MAG: tetraacyldisaccharide 4'-kinase [Bacteroidetes bacterium]|nr:tetraacyldisaccharide 4'-kinase [Bacteroidota bacterium]